MGKKHERGTETDIPRRIYASTIKRMDAHLKDESVLIKGRPKIKQNFNEFLVKLLDIYEALEASPRLFTLQTFKTLEEARGQAIKDHVASKKPLKWPMIVVQVGQDGE